MDVKSLFLIIEPPASPSVDANDTQNLRCIKLAHSADDPAISKFSHDIRGSIAALRMNLQIQEEDLVNPTELTLRKFAQLNSHINRLSQFADQMLHLLISKTK